MTTEYRFDRTPDGSVWTQTMFSYSFWTRYLEVFDQVGVLARVQDVRSLPPGFTKVDGAGVYFSAVPHYLGPKDYLMKARQVRQAVKRAIAPEDAVILRVPGQVGTVAVKRLQAGHPYGLEVVGDPYDVFAPGATKHPLRPYFRWQFSQQLKQQCKEACAVSYVTEKALQGKYPPAISAFTTHYSSIEFSTKSFVANPRTDLCKQRPHLLITVGSLAQLYKAPDILINALALCVQAGLDLQLVLVGDGKHRQELEARVKRCGLEKRVFFLGQLAAGQAVREQLDRADIFVLPSRTEGLPRVMIEAMARGLPCIGSTVGGIPELLPAEDMVPPNDAAALANKIHDVITNPERMVRMSARNLEKAREYRDEVLRERRVSFYTHLREKTEAWLIDKKSRSS